jgi:LysR family transcriptional regulator, regulator of abg operon
VSASPANPERLAARLRFRHLQLLLALERGGSLRAAAQAMNLTQPALSKALGEIESAFGLPLFERHARGLAPTARGRLALQGAALLLAQLAHLQQEVVADEPAVLLRLGAPPFVAHGYLPAVLARLTRGHEATQVALVEERVPVLLRQLAAGELDALVTSYPAQMPEDLGTQLRYEKLFEAQIRVIAAPTHRLARSRRIGWEALAQERWVMPAPTAMIRRAVDECFLRSGVPAPAPVVESTSPVTNIELVAQGVGIGVAPEASVRTALAQKRLVTLPVRPAIPAGPVSLIWRHGPEDPRLDLLRAALRR